MSPHTPLWGEDGKAWRPPARRALADLRAAGCPGADYTSKRGVPMLVIAGTPGGDDFVSVCWMRRTGVYRFFWPVGDGTGGQMRRDFTYAQVEAAAAFGRTFLEGPT